MSELQQESEPFSNFLFNPGTSSDAVREVEFMLGVSLPADYVTFVCRSNGGEGFIGGHYLVLERVEKLKSMNDNCETAQYAPGLLLFGSDGAGEAYAFDTRHHPWTVVQVPFIVMDLEDAWPVGQTFSEFLRIFGSPQPDRKFTRGEEI